MKNINETELSLFKDTPSKRFLMSVIDNLVRHGRVSIEEINKKDEELDLVWNWLNKAASTFKAEKIIELLQRLDLFEYKTNNIDLPIIKEYRDAVIRKAQRRNKKSLIETTRFNRRNRGLK